MGTGFWGEFAQRYVGFLSGASSFALWAVLDWG